LKIFLFANYWHSFIDLCTQLVLQFYKTCLWYQTFKNGDSYKKEEDAAEQ
jgi:hypothetical protein